MEDALVRLDRLTQEEVRMAAAQGLRATHVVRDEVKGVGDHIHQVDTHVQGVDGKVQGVDDHIQQVDDRVQGVSSHVQQVDTHVQGVDDKVQGVDDKIRGIDDKIQGVDNKVQQFTDHMGDQKRSSSNNLIWLAMNAQLLSQGISFEKTSETGSLPQIHL
jgi:methyl-accepting chemotaxis protein